MTGRDASRIEAHVVVSLKEYVDALFKERQSTLDVRFEAAQRAIDKAESAMCERLKGMNEFREQLDKQASKFITRDEMDLKLKPVCDDVRLLRDAANVAKGKASQTSMLVSAAIAAIGLIIGIVNLFGR